MKKYKLLSAVLASAMALGTVPFVNAGAVYHVVDSSYDLYAGKTVVPNDLIDEKIFSIDVNSRYLDENAPEGEFYIERPDTGSDAVIYGLKKLKNKIYFDFADGANDDELGSALDELYELHPEKRFTFYSSDVQLWNRSCYEMMINADIITNEDVRLVGDFLRGKGLVKNLIFANRRYYVKEFDLYYKTFSNLDEEQEDQLYEVIESMDTEFGIEKKALKNGNSSITVSPVCEMSVFNEFELYSKIYDELGIKYSCISPLSNNEAAVYVDALDYVDGDANADGELSIDDAVAVMQSIANPDKYKLTAQGEYNADMNGDGITAKDALSIQERLLGR